MKRERLKIAMVLAGLLCLAAMPASAQDFQPVGKIDCTVTAGHTCNAAGCKPGPPDRSVLRFDFKRKWVCVWKAPHCLAPRGVRVANRLRGGLALVGDATQMMFRISRSGALVGTHIFRDRVMSYFGTCRRQ
jgi:hypothetical protein